MAANPQIRELGKSPYHLLKRAAQYAWNLYTEEVGYQGLTQRQFAVLLAVEQNEGTSQTRLVELTGIDRSTLAELVARLTKQGYLQRRRTKEDQRTNQVRLSAAGRRVLANVQPGAATVDRRLLEAVPATLRRSFVEALTVLSDALERQSENGIDKPPRGPRRKDGAD
jgi:DNA-binding MarR family transcriptional regulator